MKKIYTSLALMFCVLLMQAQENKYQYSLSFVGLNDLTNNYQIALVATPNFNAPNGNTADLGVSFYVPEGLGLSIGNFAVANSNIPESEWEAYANPVGDIAGQELFQLIRTPTVINYFIDAQVGVPIQLAVFDVIADVNPTTGILILAENDAVGGAPVWSESWLNVNFSGNTLDFFEKHDPAANSINFNNLSTADSFLDKNISIHPNPASDIINIETNLPLKKVELFDILGKQVLDSNSVNQIKVDYLSAGIYLMKLFTENGTTVKKIVIE